MSPMFSLTHNAATTTTVHSPTAQPSLSTVPYLPHLQSYSTTTVPTSASTQTPAITTQQVNPPTQYEPHHDNYYQQLAYAYQDAIQQNHNLNQQSKEKDNKHQAEVKSLKSSVSAKEKEIGELKGELETLKSISPKVTKKHLSLLESLVTENKELLEKNKELTSKQIQPTFFGERTEWEVKFHNVASKLKRSCHENKSLMNRNDSLEDTLRVIQTELMKLNNELKTSEEENKNLKASETRLHSLIVSSKLRNEQLSRRVSILNNDNQKLTNHISGAELQKQELEQELRDLKDINTYQAHKFKIERQSLKKMLNTLEMEKQSLVERIKRLECENQDRDTVQSELEQLKKSSSSQQQKLQQKLDRESERLREVVKTVNDKSAEIEMLKRDSKNNMASLQEKHENFKIYYVSKMKKNHEELMAALRLRAAKSLLQCESPTKLDTNHRDNDINDGENSSRKKIRLNEAPVNLNPIDVVDETADIENQNGKRGRKDAAISELANGELQ
ncbi:unnamed protein product [Orchesella dallaii]|uniref:Uncharacterized protein n=1 Tax=Orchesella dallaii TaxID=48710 RepID=A0ABP1RHZ3_9HEXA